jgi:hypothetical protein
VSLQRSAERWPWLTALGVWLGLSLFMAVIFNTSGLGYVDSYRLAHHGQRIAATVIKLEPHNHAGCQYSYTVAGRNHTASASACADNQKVGDEILVSYLPTDPSVSALGYPEGEFRTHVLLNVFVPLLFAVLVSGRRLVACAQRRRRRLTRGLAVSEHP